MALPLMSMEELHDILLWVEQEAEEMAQVAPKKKSTTLADFRSSSETVIE